MTWSDTPIDGQQSVAANKSPINTAFTYIANTMKNDHFWDDTNANLDGRHQFVQMPKSSANPAIGTDMDSVLFTKDTTEGKSELFYRNSSAVYQLSPSYLTGTHVVTASYTNMVAVPASSYGDIWFFRASTVGKTVFQKASFRSTATVVEGWSVSTRNLIATDSTANVTFGNGSGASGLNLRVKTGEAAAGNTWTYKVIYWEI